MRTTRLVTFHNSFHASLLEGVLSNEGISCFALNEGLCALFGFFPGFEIDIYVYVMDYDRASQLLKTGFPEFARE